MGRPARDPLDPGRAIVDLAQEDLPFDELVRGILEVMRATLGCDTALAVQGDDPSTLIALDSEQVVIELAEKTLRQARTRYIQELLPVFLTSERDGACLDSQFFPSARSRRASLYCNEILEPAGVRSMLQLCARWKGRTLLRINLNRHGGQAFREEDLERALRLLPVLEASIVAANHGGAEPSLGKLTPRERDIAALVGKGLSNPQIGEILGTSTFTVRNQLTQIFQKLEVESRAELAAYVVSRPLA